MRKRDILYRLSIEEIKQIKQTKFLELLSTGHTVVHAREYCNVSKRTATYWAKQHNKCTQPIEKSVQKPVQASVQTLVPKPMLASILKTYQCNRCGVRFQDTVADRKLCGACRNHFNKIAKIHGGNR